MTDKEQVQPLTAEQLDDLFGRMRLLEKDHEPDGWPAVQIRDISALLRQLRRHRERDKKVKLVLGRALGICRVHGYTETQASIDDVLALYEQEKEQSRG